MTETSGGTGATERVADVLLLFTDGPTTLGVTRVSRELGLSKAVVHRILQSLTGRGLIAYDPACREYRLGPAAAALGSRALRESDLRTAALPFLAELRDQLHETVTISAKVHGGRVYLDQVVGTHEITMSVELGRRFPLHAGSSGKCMLAHSDPGEVERVLGGELAALTPSTPTDPDALRTELARIREAGYAASAGERQGDAGSVAVPVFGPGGLVGAVSVCGPRFRVTDEFVAATAPELIETADRITARLGGVAPARAVPTPLGRTP
ncbi:transcriptional regulator, IclR family [Pseudonocardia ammonioxydans]|uniref:Transcriptional regulator, IclR family n=1 Tax=Pseudonocardia ammonioxydans TaxID=260086 RepID=A0A1I4SHJ4_PSUAM|nr:IclR family transcriptional regulator [Pseudonocardia ammonioxydans]SFM63780.1 transcriptional regulator, IclR family [Pseudonocardia ammonioxydans]